MRKKGEAPTDGEVFAILLDEEPAALSTGFDGRGVPGRAANGHLGLGTQGGAGGRKASLPPAPLAEIRPLTENQRAYVEAIRANDVVFAIGPAGTGKTYLAVAEAVAALRSGEVRKLMLTRPAVEAGEKLGFLPGDFQAKINPYLRPLYDALEEMLRYGEVQRSIENGLIEIVPLAYMRGRTLKNAFIILDEAQNTTHAQMKMFLTRMGSGSKIVVTGDVTQMDLPEGATSGLVEAARVLRGVKGLAFVEFLGDRHHPPPDGPADRRGLRARRRREGEDRGTRDRRPGGSVTTSPVRSRAGRGRAGAVGTRARAPVAREAGGVALSGSLRGIAPVARARAGLEALRREAERLHGGPVRLDVASMSDPEIRRANRRFLRHDFATDVVSFPLSEPGDAVLVGALAVSRDTARREAARRGHAPYHEWMLYVVHGTLHLLGHDDHAPAARRRMRRAEGEILTALGLPPVFARPARAGAAAGRGRARDRRGTGEEAS